MLQAQSQQMLEKPAATRTTALASGGMSLPAKIATTLPARYCFQELPDSGVAKQGRRGRAFFRSSCAGGHRGRNARTPCSTLLSVCTNCLENIACSVPFSLKSAARCLSRLAIAPHCERTMWERADSALVYLKRCQNTTSSCAVKGLAQRG